VGKFLTKERHTKRLISDLFVFSFSCNTKKSLLKRLLRIASFDAALHLCEPRAEGCVMKAFLQVIVCNYVVCCIK
jgi:hypothetical protein